MPDDLPPPETPPPPLTPAPDPKSSSRRERFQAKALQLQRDWKGIAFPEGEGPWFAADEVARMPNFDPERTAYTPVNAWWLAELCRLAYTPDQREKSRPWSLFDRAPHLQRSPFREIHSIHKSGTHAAIYHLIDRKKSPTQAPAATILCFRGTTKFRQWVMNLSPLPARWHIGTPDKITPVPESPGSSPAASATTSSAFVHQGFQILFDRIWPILEPLLRDDPGPLFVTGHSLGAALALMSAATLDSRRAALYTFGSPRVGNTAFGDLCDAAGFPHHRVVHHHDIVTLLPHSVETFAPYDFRHHGDKIHLRADEVAWQPDKPLTFLASTFKSAHPPECILDHFPINYARTLLADCHV